MFVLNNYLNFSLSRIKNNILTYVFFFCGHNFLLIYFFNLNFIVYYKTHNKIMIFFVLFRLKIVSPSQILKDKNSVIVKPEFLNKGPAVFIKTKR